MGENLNAYDQEGNQPVFNIYIGCQFTLSLTLMKTDAEILIPKRVDFFVMPCISLLKNNSSENELSWIKSKKICPLNPMNHKMSHRSSLDVFGARHFYHKRNLSVNRLPALKQSPVYHENLWVCCLTSGARFYSMW